MSQRLPRRPHFQLLRRHAKAVLRVGRLLQPAWRLADAQQALARGYGLADWPALKRHVASTTEPANASGRPHEHLAPPSTTETMAVMGRWLLQDSGATSGVGLEIGGHPHALVLTQVIATADARVVANSMTIRPDGAEHELAFGDGLTLQAGWSDAHTLWTTVRREGTIVAQGSYVVASDGNSLVATVSGLSRVFVRAGGAETQPGARRPHGQGLPQRLAMFVAVTATVAAPGCAGGASPLFGSSQEGMDVDRRAIEALNRHDVAAGLTSDIDAVIAQWSEDFVLLPAVGPIVRGKAANAAMMERARPQLETFEPIAYEVQFEEIAVAGDLAFGWGHFRSVARVRETGADIVSSGKLLRIYQRQPDGRWLMHRTVSTLDVPGR